MYKIKKTIPLITDYSVSPVVRFIYKDKEYYALVDTGSEVTLIDRRFAEENGVDSKKGDKESLTLTGLSSESSSPYRHACITIDMWARLPESFSKLKICGALSDLTVVQSQFDKRTDSGIRVPVLLGSDMLSLIDADIDYAEQTFSYYDISGE